MAGITLPPSLEVVDGVSLGSLSILITSSVSPLLSLIPASLSGADGVVVEAFSFGVPVFVVESSKLPPALLVYPLLLFPDDTYPPLLLLLPELCDVFPVEVLVLLSPVLVGGGVVVVPELLSPVFVFSPVDGVSSVGTSSSILGPLVPLFSPDGVDVSGVDGVSEGVDASPGVDGVSDGVPELVPPLLLDEPIAEPV